MRKALSLPRLVSEPSGLLWAILWGEVGMSLLLVAGGGIAPVALRALQLFLRF
ncbi:MAG: hypothetical protein LC796_15590 [Acidobacteria bacterium]|nr:hypothetical protein [Acidobacteriota bacterium]